MKKLLLLFFTLFFTTLAFSQTPPYALPVTGSNCNYQFVLPNDCYEENTHFFWWFGDGSYQYQVIDVPPNPVQHTTHLYAQPGSYTVTLEVMKKRDDNPPPMVYQIPVTVVGSCPAVITPDLDTNFLSIQVSANNQLRAGDTLFIVLPFKPCDTGAMDYTFTFDDSQLAFLNATLPAGSGIVLTTPPNSSSVTFTSTYSQQSAVLLKFAITAGASGTCHFEFSQEGKNCSDLFTKDYDIIAYGDPYDPNKMEPDIAMSNTCNLSNKYIKYKVQFQNTGEGPTEYVLLKILKDRRLIAGSFQLLGCSHTAFSAVNNASMRFAYDPAMLNRIVIDSSTNKDTIYIELHGLRLAGMNDPRVTDINTTKGYVEFKMKVGDDGVMGDDIVCITDIIFNTNIPVQTNVARTSCCKQSSSDSSCEKRVCYWHTLYWIIISILLLIILLLIILLLLLSRRKSNKKRKKE